MAQNDKDFAAAWFAAGRTADYVCTRCGAKPDDFDKQCSADLADPCPGFQAIEQAREEFLAHWDRRTK